MPKNYTIPKTTAERQREKQKLSTLEAFCLDAYIISKLPNADKLILAYDNSRPKESQANRQSIYMLARKWITANKCKYYIEDRRKELFTHDTFADGQSLIDSAGDNTENTTADSNRTKTQTISELNKLATNTSDAKLKAEILLKISDLEGWKKEKELNEDDTIRYYLPLRCNVCELYKAARAENANKKDN